MHDTDELVDWCTGDLLANGLGSPGERVVIVFGAPIGVSGSTNTIRVHVLGVEGHSLSRQRGGSRPPASSAPSAGR